MMKSLADDIAWRGTWWLVRTGDILYSVSRSTACLPHGKRSSA